MAASNSLLKMKHNPGKGRGLFAAQPLKAGQLVLRESPLILYSASPLLINPPQSSFSYSCDHCFRSILPPKDSSTISCPSCSHHHFCSHNCLNNALESSHSSWVCQVLSHLRHSAVLIEQPSELQLQARFLVAAYNLAIMSPSDLHTLLSMPGIPDASILDAAHLIHSLISPLFPPHTFFPVDLTAKLLAKNKFSAIWLMDPYSPDAPQRFTKAYAIYPNATMFNHDCIPNACRFNYIDASDPDDEYNTDIFIRLVQDVPEGSEICTCYCNIKSDYSTRKDLCENYGFTCDCDRCNIEANWSNGQNNGEYDDLPHLRFLSKHACDTKTCEGILAPLPPKNDALSNVLECNYCANLKIATTA